jgi:hypothetical protein
MRYATAVVASAASPRNLGTLGLFVSNASFFLPIFLPGEL